MFSRDYTLTQTSMKPRWKDSHPWRALFVVPFLFTWHSDLLSRPDKQLPVSSPMLRAYLSLELKELKGLRAQGLGKLPCALPSIGHCTPLNKRSSNCTNLCKTSTRSPLLLLPRPTHTQFSQLGLHIPKLAS